MGSELRSRNAAKFEEKLRYPAYGNSVNHEQLFSGKITAAAYTPARRWLVSPQIFTERLMDVFGVKGKDREPDMVGVTNPFLLADAAGVRYYDNTALNLSHRVRGRGA